MATLPGLARRAVGWGVLMGLLGGAAVVGGTWGVPEPAPPAPGQDDGPSREELLAERAAVLRRVEAKRQAVEAVLAGQLPPAEAVERFRAFKAELRRRYTPWQGPISWTPFEKEALCQDVMSYARDALRDRPDGAGEALARLEQGLHAYVVSQGFSPESARGGGP